MNKIIVLIGISGSGKSTWATNFVKENENWIRVNRDDVRKQLVGELKQEYYKREGVRKLENDITILQDEQVSFFLKKGYNVIIDNTHLDKKYIKHIFEEYQMQAQIELKYFDIPLQEAKTRVSAREGEIDTSYIDRQFQQYTSLKANHLDSVFDYYKLRKFYINKKYPKCIIVDIDGTIANHKGIRSPYDGLNCGLDKVIEETKVVVKSVRGNWLKRLINPVKIVYLSGRSEEWKNITRKWLTKNKFPSGDLFMRKEGDSRPDWQVKYELYNDNVKDKYHTLFCIDDRHQMVKLWTKCGLFVFDVNQDKSIF